MNIHQLSVTYDAPQDRLLVRINTTDRDELRLWLTRRMALGLLPRLRQSVGDMELMQSPGAPAQAVSRELLSELRHAQRLSQADFSRQFDEQATQWPLGQEPLLVTEIKVEKVRGDTLQLSFDERLPDKTEFRAFQVSLALQLLHGIVHLLDNSVTQAGWHSATGDLGGPPLLHGSPEADDESAAKNAPRVLH